MLPEFCREKHAPEAGTYGDCVRACVASILEIDALTLPNWFGASLTDGMAAISAMRETLRSMGLYAFVFGVGGGFTLREVLDYMGTNNGDGFYILWGATEYGGNHSVVCRGNTIAHDPSWAPVPLVGPCDGAEWVIIVVGRS